MAKLTFSMGGIHPNDSKYARECAIEELPLPSTVYVSMAQHLGAPAKPLVAPGDQVKVGQVIAEPGGFISGFRYRQIRRAPQGPRRQPRDARGNRRRGG